MLRRATYWRAARLWPYLRLLQAWRGVRAVSVRHEAMQGSHAELLALGGYYADLHQKQLLEEELEAI